MSPQRTIAHYQITAKLGEGGMGEVWRATDTKLNRDVAIKILPDVLAQDADRMARFQREAQVLASLNHPNIAVIHGVEEHALILELVEGHTLAERIAAGPIPLEEVLPIAKQIAEALEYAHERGVVHRDLKPANIKITPDGKVKVLDFGLAAVAQASAAGPADPLSSPTLTMRATQIGVIMGTAAYMSPEQASGKPVDKRADIWSFGAVLWEMLTGKRLFEGETISHTLADVLRAAIDFGKLSKDAPPPIRNLVRRCLDRDVKKRLRDIGEARIVLESPLAPETAAVPMGTATMFSRFWKTWCLSPGFAFALLAALAFWSPWRHAAPDDRPVHFQVIPPPGAQFALGAGGGSAISPDGRMIAFVAVSSAGPGLWVRSLDSVAAHELSGTDGAQFPFWSPDSRSIGFFAGGKMKRIDLSGAAPVVLVDAPTPRGGSWNQEGTIIFAGRAAGVGLQRVPASGGTSSPLTTLDRAAGETGHRSPRFMPDGRRFLYHCLNRDPSRNAVYLASLERPSERTRLLETQGGGGLYIPPRGRYPGYFLWLRQGIVAQPFDASTARFTGEAVQVPGAEAVFFISAVAFGAVSASSDGTILFAGGNERYRLSWLNREGKSIASVGQGARWGSLRISPDGARVAASLLDSSGQRDIYVIDFARGVQTRVTSGNTGIMPIWSPDSLRIVYYAGNSTSISERSATATGQPETILELSHSLYSNDWSPDGRYLLYEDGGEGRVNLWLLPRTGVQGQRKPIPYLKTSSNQNNGQFSPDSKWIAYTSDESGHEEVYVQGFPATEQKWQVSNGGGNYARWRRDGKELFYRAGDGKLMAVSVRAAGRGLEFGVPVALFRIIEPTGPHTYPYDVAPDGQRILALTADAEDNTTTLTVLLNWQAGLKP
jgi:Tol biopolymer transport system component